MTSQQQQEKTNDTTNQDKIKELRVCGTELNYFGNSSGKVYSRLSDGACAFLLTESRSDIKKDISIKLRKELLKHEQQEQEKAGGR
jgi:hypothetical protein